MTVFQPPDRGCQSGDLAVPDTYGAPCRRAATCKHGEREVGVDGRLAMPRGLGEVDHEKRAHSVQMEGAPRVRSSGLTVRDVAYSHHAR